MQTLFYKFAEMFSNVAFDGGFQWKTIISIMDTIMFLARGWNHNPASIQIPEDLMKFLLKQGYYGYFMSGNICKTFTKEDITLKVFLQFTHFYEVINILISLFHSNAFDDKYQEYEFRCIAVSRVFNLVGHYFLKSKFLKKYLFEKSFSLFCNKHFQHDNMKYANNDHIINVVSSRFITIMNKFVQDPGKILGYIKKEHNKVLDDEMNNFVVPYC
jgi:hypothetical protein